MHYDYRVIRRDFHKGLLEYGEGPYSTYTLAEVTYDQDGIARNYDASIELNGRSLKKLEWQLDELQEALKRPALKMYGNELREVKEDA